VAIKNLSSGVALAKTESWLITSSNFFKSPTEYLNLWIFFFSSSAYFSSIISSY